MRKEHQGRFAEADNNKVIFRSSIIINNNRVAIPPEDEQRLLELIK